MTAEPPWDRIRLAIGVTDPTLAERLLAALGNVPGIELVSDPADADAVVTAAEAGSRHRGSTGAASADPSGEPAITPRELEVLVLLAEGASNKVIARRLGISAHTAKFHVGSLLDKLDAVSRTDAVAHAARLGVIVL